MRMFDQDVPLAGIGERQETQWRNPDHVLARGPHWAKHLAIPAPGAHPRKPLAAPLETDRVPHFPSLRVSQTPVLAPPPTSVLVQPTLHSGGDSPQPKEKRLVAPECSQRHGPGAASGRQVLKRRFKDTGLYTLHAVWGGWEAGRLEIWKG